MQNSGNVPAAKIEVKNFGELENFQRKYFGSRGCIATRYENVSEWSLVVIKKVDVLESILYSVYTLYFARNCWFPFDIGN